MTAIVAPIDGDIADPAWAADITDAINALAPFTADWSSWTPQWHAYTSEPAIGNGTLLGYYMQVGKLVVGYLYLLAGSTTTFGSNYFYFSLPIAPVYAQAGTGVFQDVSSSNRWALSTVLSENGTIAIVAAADGTGGLSGVVPVAMANGDSVWMSFMYRSV